MRVKCLAQEHNTMTPRPELKPRLLDPALKKCGQRALKVLCFSFAGLAKITNLRRACVCPGVSCTHTTLIFVGRENFVPQDQQRLER